MRYLLCSDCSESRQPGTRQVYALSPDGPAEFERVVLGVAITPDPDSRFMWVNGERIRLPLDEYQCDLCNRTIKVGDRCCAWTVWAEDELTPTAWESSFLTMLDWPTAGQGFTAESKKGDLGTS